MPTKKTPAQDHHDPKKALLEKIEVTELRAREAEAQVRLIEARQRLKALTDDARERTAADKKLRLRTQSPPGLNEILLEGEGAAHIKRGAADRREIGLTGGLIKTAR